MKNLSALPQSLISCFIFFLCCIGISSQAQDTIVKHNFKIVGDDVKINGTAFTKVEYDPHSPDHLFLIDFNQNGQMTTKTQYLFTGKKFNIANGIVYYKNTKELMMDGEKYQFRTDGKITFILIYQKDSIIREIYYYPEGMKKGSAPGIDYFEGELKTWYKNGQLKYSGNYTKNLKNGDFEHFDETGILIKKGTYKDGLLISGEPIVPDINYIAAETPVKFKNGEDDFGTYLTQKIDDWNVFDLKMNKKIIYLNLLVDENGLLKTMRSYRNANEKEIAALNHALEGAPSLFEPALIEQIPVDCNFAIELQISEKLIKVKPVERMSAKVVVFPEFPGGDDALRKFIKTKLNYPLEAARLRIQGKVFVSFSVEIDGTVSEVFVARGVHPLLDEEALRVTKLMPKWKPGEVNGKPARVSHTLPINFIL